MGQDSKKYSDEGGAKGGKSEFYETFDSGGGILVPDGMESDFAHNDSGSNLSDMSDQDGAVPEVPSKKR